MGSNKNAPKGRGRYFLISAFLVAIVLAFIVSPFASKAPDGLEKVAGQHGFLKREVSLLHGSPLADYIFPGIKNTLLARGLAGIIGTVLVFALGFLFVYTARKTDRKRARHPRRKSDFS